MARGFCSYSPVATPKPSPLNYTGVTRSTDKGKTWTPLARPSMSVSHARANTIGQGPTELMITGQRSTLFFSTHSKHWANDWRSWYLTSDDSFKTWSKPIEVPGRLKERTVYPQDTSSAKTAAS